MDPDAEVAWHLERELRECPVVVRFSLPGDPASKSRARFTKRGSKTFAYTPEKTKQAEEAVAWAARAAGASGPSDPDGSYGLLAIFFTATWQRRDCDNMLKLVSDGLTGIIWKDDSQVTEMSTRVVRKDQHPRTHVLVYQTLRQAPRTTRCPVCGKPVRHYDSVRYQHCSRECAMQGRRTVAWSCRTCGRAEMRTPARARVVYCDEACRRADPQPRVRRAARVS